MINVRCQYECNGCGFDMQGFGDVYKRQVLPLNVGNICFYDTNGNVVEYLRQQL